MLSYIKERFHQGYIPTGLHKGWSAPRLHLRKRILFVEFFFAVEIEELRLVNGHLKKRREALRGGGIYCEAGLF